jgi:hypothetical protein
MNFMLALIELQLSATVVFGVAGWVSYLTTEKGAAIGGGDGAVHEDEEFCATPPQSYAE